MKKRVGIVLCLLAVAVILIAPLIPVIFFSLRDGATGIIGGANGPTWSYLLDRFKIVEMTCMGVVMLVTGILLLTRKTSQMEKTIKRCAVVAVFCGAFLTAAWVLVSLRDAIRLMGMLSIRFPGQLREYFIKNLLAYIWLPILIGFIAFVAISLLRLLRKDPTAALQATPKYAKLLLITAFCLTAGALVSAYLNAFTFSKVINGIVLWECLVHYYWIGAVVVVLIAVVVLLRCAAKEDASELAEEL